MLRNGETQVLVTLGRVERRAHQFVHVAKCRLSPALRAHSRFDRDHHRHGRCSYSACSLTASCKTIFVLEHCMYTHRWYGKFLFVLSDWHLARSL